jgi:hypothetical protein
MLARQLWQIPGITLLWHSLVVPSLLWQHKWLVSAVQMLLGSCIWCSL